MSISDIGTRKGGGSGRDDTLAFLSGGGDMGSRMRAHDWSSSSLGSPSAWPSPLRTTVQLLLNSGHPMYIWWGDDGACLYNDAYRQSIGPERHPGSLGRPAREVWDEIWDIIGPQIEQVMAGKGATWHQDHLVPITRHGRREDVYWTYSYSPIGDDTRPTGVGGVLVVCVETTERVLAEKRLAAHNKRQQRLFDQAPGFIAILHGPEHVFEFVNESYKRLVGRSDFIGKPIREALPDIEGQGFFDLLDNVYATGERFVAWQTPLRLQSSEAPSEERFLDFIYEPVTDEDGNITGIFVQGHDVTEQKRAEAALRASEARLAAALALANLGTYEWDLETDAVILDERSRDIFGFAYAEDVQAQDIFDRIDPSQFERVLAEARTSQRDLSRLEIEYNIILPNGSTRSIVSISEAVPGAGGEAKRMFGVFSDITERKRAEARRVALLELTDRFRDVEDPADLAYAAAEIMGRALEVSRAGFGTIDPVAETITIDRGWNAPGIESLAGTLHFRDYGSYIEDLKRGETVVMVDATKDPRTAETANALKAISAQAFVNMPVSEQGRFVALFYLNHACPRDWSRDDIDFIRDVAERTRTAVERRRAQQALRDLTASLERQVEDRTEALRRSEARLRSIFDTSYQYQGLLTLDGTVVNANTASLRGIKAKLDDVVGKPFWDTPWFSGTPGMSDAVRDAVTAVARGETVRREMHVNLPTGWRSFDFTMRPLRDERGDIAAIVPEAVDITERRQAEDALRQSQKLEAMGQLTGGVAHDFNNLLTPIVGSLDLLRRRGVGGDREQRLIDGALQSADRAKTLVQRLLAFARRQPLQATSVDVAGLVTGMADLVASTTGPQIKVVVDVADGVPAARADANQLEMAILNLAVNARDVMSDGGTLRISAAGEAIAPGHRSGLGPGAYVRLSVADTGTGMDEATLARAVEPFFSTKGIGKGTGLGLSMVHGLASQLGGALALSSKPGLGTNVELWLPQAPEPVETEPDPVAPAACSGKGTVLLVDDEALIRMSTADMLAEAGYEVVEAGSAEEALKLFDGGARIDMLVTDHMMSGMTGGELAHVVRDQRPDLPVLIISGYAETDGMPSDLPRLTKPFREADLIAFVRQMTDGDR
ncbi:MAG TPA: PAS domain-containing protein [Aestuariivirgaceae bacterium]|nr:PAS domain-containing protein [Aestuariivirgaceae bacterium]